MTRAELEHAIRAACDVSGDDEVYVFGSQAILGDTRMRQRHYDSLRKLISRR